MRSKKKIFVLTGLILGFIPVTGTADLISVTSGGSDFAVHDTFYDQYWFPDLGFFGGGDLAFVQSQIASLNSSEYFGITDWHLATPAEVETISWLQYTEPWVIGSLFTPSYTTSETYLIGDTCFPEFGFYEGCTELNVDTAHYSGIIDDPVRYTAQVSLPPGIPCGGFFPPCTYPVETDAHYGRDFQHQQYSNGMEWVEIVSIVSSDDGLGFGDTFSITGGWVIGSYADGGQGNYSTVPEPGTLTLLGIGLAALGLSRRRRQI